MFCVRCEICRTRLPTPKRLQFHYLRGHSKFELVRKILKLSINNVTPKVLGKKRKNLGKTTERAYETKAKMVFANESVQILCSDNEIIIRDDKRSVDMEFCFDGNVEEDGLLPSTKLPTDKYVLRSNVKGEVNNNTKSNCKKLPTFKTNKNSKYCAASSSSASSEDSSKMISFKKGIRKRRGVRDKTGHYKINITRSRNTQSLNENTGNFYYCKCRDDNGKTAEGTKDIKLASDTESASDTGNVNNFKYLKVFCRKCGNGYRDEQLLFEHMKIHETQCRVCYEIFPNEQEFKQHVETHIFKVFMCPTCSREFRTLPMFQQHSEEHKEDALLESVLDMEEDYNVVRHSNVLDVPYQSGIDNIVSYMMKPNEGSEFYCDVCRTVIFFEDYSYHMRGHCIYPNNLN